MDGILNTYKPCGPTSHDIVARVRRILHTRRVGHAGTLDPAADGVLVIFLGVATRLIEYTAGAEKEYLAECTFGAATTTLDATGEITATADASGLTLDALCATLPRFTGTIQQVPPMYSAVHHQGQRLYELARRGEEVERAAREVTIYRLEVLEFVPGVAAKARLRVVCSTGTYVRTLCADLGSALGLPAHMSALTRTRVGPFHVEDAVHLDDLAEAAGWQGAPEASPLNRLVLPAAAAVSHLPAVRLDEEELARVRHGNAVPVPPAADVDGPLRIEAPDGSLVGVGHVRRTDSPRRLQPDKIL